MYIYFGLTVAFLLATLATTFIDYDIKKDLINQLTNEEIELYKKIKKERLLIYYQGLIFGIVLSILYFIINKDNNMFIGITITFVVNYFYYILYPKSVYMIEVLNTKEENQAWLKIYRYMQYRYHLSFLLGLIFAYFLYKTLFLK